MSHQPSPIPKKIFEIPLTGMELLQEKYLRHFKCWKLNKILNKYSVFDYLVNSGYSTIVIEVKERTKSVVEYDSCLMEKEKYLNLMKMQRGLNSPSALFITMFTDCILIHHLIEDEQLYKWELKLCQKSEEDKTKVWKPCTLLPYEESTIIGKKEFKRATFKELTEYIRRERNAKQITLNNTNMNFEQKPTG